MILQINFRFGLENYLVNFLGELLGRTRLNYEYEISYPSISTMLPTITISGIGNSEDLEFVMLALRKIEDLRDDGEERLEVQE